MSLGSSLLFLLIAILCLVLLSPIRVQWEVNHQTRWNGSAAVQFWWMRHQIKFSNGALLQKLEQRLGDTFLSQDEQHSVQIYWRPVLEFAGKAVQAVAKRLHLERLRAQCCIGWERADLTAYTYGAFWALMAALPEHWLKQSEIVYIPDFQYNRQEIQIEGIIRIRAGQLIGMLIALFRLTIQMMLEQNRKEQMAYEN